MYQLLLSQKMNNPVTRRPGQLNCFVLYKFVWVGNEDNFLTTQSDVRSSLTRPSSIISRRAIHLSKISGIHNSLNMLRKHIGFSYGWIWRLYSEQTLGKVLFSPEL